MVSSVSCLLEVVGLPLHQRQVMPPAPEDIQLHHQELDVVGLGMLGKEVFDVCSAFAASEQLKRMVGLSRWHGTPHRLSS